MKIRTARKSYEQVIALPAQAHLKPVRQHILFRILLRVLSTWDLWATHFTYRKIGMERLKKGEPCLVLMNHSSFIDLKIAIMVLFPRSFHIVCTSDGFVGKKRLMRRLGCIPTRKFMNDVVLVRDMIYALRELKSSVLLYPEASYSFDGTQTPLPESIGKCLKLLKVPVVMIRTQGAFARDPLYNNLQLRKVKVSAEVEYLLSPEEIAQKTQQELNAILQENFTFDYFRWQQENKVRISESFRADGLNRMLYKCPECLTEGEMRGQGISLTCARCGKSYELTEYGFLRAKAGETIFNHIPDWYRWERDCVREELLQNTYHMEVPVDIYMMVNMNYIYQVGEGILTHTREGFSLNGCNGKIHYTQAPSYSYSLYSDFYWYEIGDMICIGDEKAQYYCFPKEGGDIVAKTRLAVEELYKLVRQESAGRIYEHIKSRL